MADCIVKKAQSTSTPIRSQSRLARVRLSCQWSHLLELCLMKVGECVAQNAVLFVVVPILLAVIFALGIRDFRYETDNEYLFVPVDAIGLQDRGIIENMFPTNFAAYVPGHESRYQHMVEAIVVAKDGGSVMRPDIWQDTLAINKFITDKMVVQVGYHNVSFGDVCARYNGECLKNGFLALANFIDDMADGKLNLSYPIMKNPVTFVDYIVPAHIGGLKLSPDAKHIEDAKALRIVFPLDSTDGLKKMDTRAWEAAALSVLTGNISSKHIIVQALDSTSIARELVDNIQSAIDLFPVAVLLVMWYTVANTYDLQNPVKIKVWLGVAGILNTLMATLASWGLMGYTGLPWQAINLASIFLLLGVGLDDTFVFLSSWERTRVQDPITERMRECYKEAAVSITITSLTNVCSFVVGAIFPGFRCVEIFCWYTSVGMIFIYFFTITFLGACFAIYGMLEQSGRHGMFFFWPADSFGKRIALARPKTGRRHLSEWVFDQWLPKLLPKKSTMGLILCVFAVYWALSVFWIMQTQQGLERQKLGRDHSAIVSYYNKEDQFFRTNPYRIQIAFTQPLDYSNQTVVASIHQLLAKLRSSKYISPMAEFSEVWIEEFETFLAKKAAILKEQKSAGQPSHEDWLRDLKDFLQLSQSTPLASNVVLNRNKTNIDASRVFLQSAYLPNATEEMQMTTELRSIVRESGISGATVFHPYFVYFDQFILVMSSTITCLWVSTLIVLLVAFLFIPSMKTSLLVAFTIISIEVGVMGLMALFHINLDVISMISLIMCVGFAVDFSAHISYHFIVAGEHMDAKQRLRASLASFGMPVIQGAMSTVLAVLPLAFLSSYILRSFAITLIVVIVLGVLHGLLLLPVLLTLFHNLSVVKKKLGFRGPPS